MVLSNLNNNMDVESRTMATMGDTLGGSVQTGGRGPGARRLRAACRVEGTGLPCLWHRCHWLFTIFDFGRIPRPRRGPCVSSASKGLLDAAHFCYLMAEVGFGVYTKKTTKLVLIGSNHR